MARNTEVAEPPKTREIEIIDNPKNDKHADPKPPHAIEQPSTGKPPQVTKTPPRRTHTYAAAQQPSKPMLLLMVLAHYPN